MRVGALLGMMVAVVGLVAWAASAAAHADLASSAPAAGSTVAEAPPTLDLTFTEEVTSGGVAVRVIGPDGDEVQAGTAEVDLNDPERRHVTLSLRGNLPLGRYTVEWETTSNLDDHPESGAFTFSVGGPVASPASSPALPPAAGASAGTAEAAGASAGTAEATASSIRAEATLDPANGNPLATDDGDFDSRSFALSVGAGLVGIGAIVGFWRFVRPRDPVFGGRARR